MPEYLLTLGGLYAIRDACRRGETLPEGFSEAAHHYLGLKREAVRRLGPDKGRKERLELAESLVKAIYYAPVGGLNGTRNRN